MSLEEFGFEADRRWEYENGFYLTSDATRIAKLVAHYDLYRSIIDLPGQVVECGVFKGASLIRFATFREMLESSNSRIIIGFDAFGAFPVPDDPEDQAFAKSFEAEAGTGIPREALVEVLEAKRFHNVELVKGDITETLPRYVQDHSELRVALLHIDVDVYKPSRAAIELLFERIVPGGLLVLDDYATVAGETRAADELLARSGLPINKPRGSHVPAYVRKPL